MLVNEVIIIATTLRSGCITGLENNEFIKLPIGTGDAGIWPQSGSMFLIVHKYTMQC